MSKIARQKINPSIGFPADTTDTDRTATHKKETDKLNVSATHVYFCFIIIISFYAFSNGVV